jgi:Mn2+/Fe2+ NRAMP family transporter
MSADRAERDPYRLDPGDIAEPPRRLGDTLRRIGPGIILAASIVGSGELIATTVLGAQVGFTCLWLILLSCFIKPIVQAELAFQSPVRMVVAGGMAQSILLPVTALGTAYLHHRFLPEQLRPRRAVTLALWVSVASILAFVVVYLAQTLRGS